MSRNGTRLCPTCHRPLPKPRALLVRDRAELKRMSVSQVHAYYKATALVEDIRFALRSKVDLSPDLAEAWAELLDEAEAGLPDAQCRYQLARLLDRWRQERLEADREAAAERPRDLFGDLTVADTPAQVASGRP